MFPSFKFPLRKTVAPWGLFDSALGHGSDMHTAPAFCHELPTEANNTKLIKHPPMSRTH